MYKDKKYYSTFFISLILAFQSAVENDQFWLKCKGKTMPQKGTLGETKVKISIIERESFFNQKGSFHRLPQVMIFFNAQLFISTRSHLLSFGLNACTTGLCPGSLFLGQ